MSPRQSTSTAREPAEELNFLNPETAVQGLDADFEGTITEAKYERWDYKGKARPKADGKSGVKMALAITVDDRDDEGKAHKEYFDAGPIEDFVPNDEGDDFSAVTGRKGFYRDSGLIQFTRAVVETGALTASDLGRDPSIFLGLRFYWERHPPLWADTDDKRKKFSVLVPTKFIETAKAASAKGGGGGNGRAGASRAASASAAASKSKASAAGPDEDAIADGAVELILEVLGDLPIPKGSKEPEPIGRENLGSEIYALMMQRKTKDERFGSKPFREGVMALFDEGGKTSFLAERAGRKTWSYDPKTDLVEPA